MSPPGLLYNGKLQTNMLLNGNFRHITYHSDDSEEDDEGHDKVCCVRVGVDVGMSGLIDLQHTQPGDHVHVRRICNIQTIMYMYDVSVTYVKNVKFVSRRH